MNHAMRGLGIVLALCGYAVGAENADTSPPAKKLTAEAIPTDKPLRIAVPQHLRGKGHKLRIKNLATGREAIIDVSDEEFLSSDVVRSLTDANTKVLVPQFSVLESKGHSVERRIPAPADPSMSGFAVSKSLIFDQPIWRAVGFRLRRGRGGMQIVEVDPKVVTVTITPEQAARRRELKEDQGLKKLFEAGWAAIQAKRYDVALDAFARILSKKESLKEDQLSQAHLGHGIAHFHQKGCENLESDFKIADRDPKNFDDVSYLRALCFVEQKRFPDAEGLFKDLARKQHPLYAEASRFYLGVVAENQERYDDAESAYLDTIDFAQDQRLVNLAKTRLEVVRRLRAEANYEHKWLSMAATLSGGYDSNVVALPQSLSPADYNISGSASPSTMGLGLLDIKAPWGGDTLENHLKYTFLMLHYTKADIASSSDAQTHNVALTYDQRLSALRSFGLVVDYSAVFLGPIATSREYLTIPGLEVHHDMWWGDAADNPDRNLQSSFKVSLVKPKVAPASPAQDLNAKSFLLSNRYTVRKAGGAYSLGPNLDIEFRPSTGTENTYFATTIGQHIDMGIGPETWKMSLSQEGDLDTSLYYQSAKSRKDYVFRYTGSIAKLWGTWFESRLQFIGTLSFSSVPESYRYNKAQVNLLLSAFY